MILQKTFALRNGTNQVNPSSPFSYKSSSTEGNANGIGSAVLEGLHSLNRSWTVDWNASYSHCLALAAGSDRAGISYGSEQPVIIT